MLSGSTYQRRGAFGRPSNPLLGNGGKNGRRAGQGQQGGYKRTLSAGLLLLILAGAFLLWSPLPNGG